jgi:hypothetical protein
MENDPFIIHLIIDIINDPFIIIYSRFYSWSTRKNYKNPKKNKKKRPLGHCLAYHSNPRWCSNKAVGEWIDQIAVTVHAVSRPQWQDGVWLLARRYPKTSKNPKTWSQNLLPPNISPQKTQQKTPQVAPGRPNTARPQLSAVSGQAREMDQGLPETWPSQRWEISQDKEGFSWENHL